ncbi:MAG: hypothetical protein ACI97A_000283 [Planctomycetota bacterium]|jgi:hypothetical protein
MSAGQLRAISLVCILLVGVSCESASDGDTDRGFGDQVFSLAETHPEAQTTQGWLNPKTLQIEVASLKPEATDMVIEGLLIGWRFVALSNVKGQIQQPPVLPRCRRVWMVLEDRSIVEQEDSSTPDRTYLSGFLDPETSLFYPESAQITRVVAKPVAEPNSDTPEEPMVEPVVVDPAESNTESGE